MPMKVMCGIALVLATVGGLTAAARGGPIRGYGYEESDFDPRDLAILAEGVLALDFANSSTPAFDEKMNLGYAPPSELVQAIHLALGCIPPHEAPGGGCVPQQDPVGDALKEIHLSLCSLIHFDQRIRLRSVRHLGEQGFEPAIDPLVALMGTDLSPAVREAAAKSLALIRPSSFDALAALRRAAKEDPSPEVRRTAAFAAEIIERDLSCNPSPVESRRLIDSVSTGIRFIF